MNALQIIVAIGFFILVIGAILLSKEWVKTGITLAAIGGILGIIGAVGYHTELDSNTPTALDVYRGKTTLEITYRDSVAIDSVVVYKLR
jgi:drug/metabolite transporter superfamily protein YnfA